MTITDHNKNYCSQKFWWLSVYPERKQISSCCSASVETIDIKWLQQNPGQLFNTANLQQERRDMLDGHRVASCHDSCWRAEDAGLVSRRLQNASTVVTHTHVNATPSTLNIVLGSDCNMTCVYCCKQFSTAWYRDIKNHGPYLDDDRFTITMVDRAIESLGQNTIKSSEVYQQILQECTNFAGLEQVYISGGEPFLYNGLPDLVNSLQEQTKININTSLGVDSRRFEKILDQIRRPVTLIISGETTGRFYELVRFGNSFERFMTNLETIRTKHIAHGFLSVLSNLTVFDFANFQTKFQPQINIQFCTDPNYLSVNVLDPASRKLMLDTDFGVHTKAIHDSLVGECSEEQQKRFAKYFLEFVRRRNLTIDMYPESFTSWLQTL